MKDKMQKVTPELYADAKVCLNKGQNRKSILEDLEIRHKIKIGMTTLRLIRVSENYLAYCTMPKYHKESTQKAIQISEDIDNSPKNKEENIRRTYRIATIIALLCTLLIVYLTFF